MKHFGLTLILFCAFSLMLCAQGGNPQDMEKAIQEKIDQEVEDYASSLKLESWQVFYVDSILNHDYKALQAELIEMNRNKVSNSDLYVIAQDKWMEKIYTSFQRVFNDEQWAKYLKTGGAKEKKARDKRAAKRNGK